ncbi:MAG TPA: type II secretion system F family protein, partial [Actinomycetota bacterium]
MPTTYQYKVRDRAGNLVSGQLIGDSEGLVMTKLRELGMTPIEVKKANAGLKMEINLRPGRVKLKDLAVFSRQFATMVNSGLPILRALSILSDQTANKELQKVLVQVRLDVEQGASLSGAMERHPKAFTNLYVAMVKAGETGGVLDNVLLRLADNIETEVELRRKIKSAMTYPVVVVALVMLILSAMLLFVVPQFESIYAQLGGDLPLPTRLLLSVSNAVRTYWYVL